MDRRAVLIEMWKSGVATPDRVTLVRTAVEDRVPKYLIEWGVPKQVLVAAGISAPGMTDLNTKGVRDRINKHLMAIEWDPLPILHRPWYDGVTMAADERWEKMLGFKDESWACEIWGPKGGRLAFRQKDPQWKPLFEILCTGQVPVGPVHGVFVIADSRE